MYTIGETYNERRPGIFFSIANIIYPNPRCVNSGDLRTIECVSMLTTVNKSDFKQTRSIIADAVVHA